MRRKKLVASFAVFFDGNDVWPQLLHSTSEAVAKDLEGMRFRRTEPSQKDIEEIEEILNGEPDGDRLRHRWFYVSRDGGTRAWIVEELR